MSPLPDLLLEPIVRMALGEDLLPSGDITSDCVIEHDTRV
ncbi:MAG: nicotinate-nucleotide diphosphorylase (carboxylating), partial [Gammaproteobacteria bacterium]|nr:nicotinate-nucleotide diphosphorylase (carboxylating) [Gammaproteobacteria bacterium]